MVLEELKKNIQKEKLIIKSMMMAPYDQYGFKSLGLNKDGYDIYGFGKDELNKDGYDMYGF